MIKLICFDLDGVLADSRQFHVQALNEALAEVDPKYVISGDEDAMIYDGIPTLEKLWLVHDNKGLPAELIDETLNRKQALAMKLITENIKPVPSLALMLDGLRQSYSLCVTSNSSETNVMTILRLMGIAGCFDYVFTGDSVGFSKPSPDIYLQAMFTVNAGARETLIIEDSYVGRLAAHRSGAHVLPVRSPEDVTLEAITNAITEAEGKSEFKWKQKMNIVVPMAGLGTRFSKAGFELPKPFIDVNGIPMIEQVLKSLQVEAHYIFLVQNEHLKQMGYPHAIHFFRRLAPHGHHIVVLDSVTEGAACTVLKAKEWIDNDDPIVIINSDNYLEWDSCKFFYSMNANKVDGGIAVFKANDPKWSFAKLGPTGLVTEVAEKKPISNLATAGVYYWAKGSDFVHYAEQMIAKNIRVNNEFYVCPVYNEAIADGKQIRIFPVDKMWGLGTPEDLQIYLDAHQ